MTTLRSGFAEAELDKLKPTLIVLSPGPGSPKARANMLDRDKHSGYRDWVLKLEHFPSHMGLGHVLLYPF